MNDNVHVIGRGYGYEDLKVGFRFRTHRRTIAESDLANFVNLTWLTEELFAVADDSQRAIKGRAVPGALVYSFAEGLLLPSMQDTGLAFLNATLDVKAPTVVGDTIHVEVEAQRWQDPSERVIVTEAEITFVCVDEKGQPIPIKGRRGAR